MIGDDGKKDDTDLDDTEDELLNEEDDEVSEDEMPDIGGDTLIDVSGEVEKLVAKIGDGHTDEAAHKREVRRRLEELAEKRSEDLDSTFNFDLDEDI